jgi:ribosomal subunit interface protein
MGPNMNVLIKGGGVEIDSELRAFIRDRIHFALSRFSSKIRNIRVDVMNKNRSIGAVEKSCRIRVRLIGNKTVTVSYSDVDVHAAIARATDQVHRAIAIRIEFGWRFWDNGAD